jgi:formiminotetrahydrofolate cyclodeaminase
MGDFTFAEKSIGEFTKELSSAAPTPGGGGVAALAGALAASLGSMVANLTIGKEKYRAVEDEMLGARAEIVEICDDLLRLVDRDAEAFAPLAAAYGLPAGSDEERSAKADVMEKALLDAAFAPLEIMRKCAVVIGLLEVLAAKGSVLAVSDAACGAALAQAALRSAWLNVCANAKLMKDAGTAKMLAAAGRGYMAEYTERAERLYERIEAGLQRK